MKKIEWLVLVAILVSCSYTQAAVQYSRQWANDGDFYESNLCIAGTDTSDCTTLESSGLTASVERQDESSASTLQDPSACLDAALNEIVPLRDREGGWTIYTYTVTNRCNNDVRFWYRVRGVAGVGSLDLELAKEREFFSGTLKSLKARRSSTNRTFLELGIEYSGWQRKPSAEPTAPGLRRI